MAYNNTTASVLAESVSKSGMIDEKIASMIFIIVVLVWYASSIVVLLGMQVGALNEIDEDWMKNCKESFAQSLRNPVNNKDILKKLVDKQKRDKLWDIYLGTSGDMHDRITRAEHLRIRNIEKQLAILNQDSDDNVWSSTTDLSSSDSRSRPRRQSSVDCQSLEQWQSIDHDLKATEKWPFAILKRMGRRHFRRRRQRSATDCRSVV